MGEVGDIWREHKEHIRKQKEKYGRDCIGCMTYHPKRIPTRLMPGQKCRVCGTTYEECK
jgi:rRNA maturation endonuclease Nob1